MRISDWSSDVCSSDLSLPVLLQGGAVRVLKKFEIDPVMAALTAGQCSAFFGVPAIYQAISLHRDFARADLSSVRSWGCGGAPLPASLIEIFARRGIRVCNGKIGRAHV